VTGNAAPPVRAVFDAVRVPGLESPIDTVHFRVAYPAAPPEPDADPTLGLVRPARSDRTMPVVVLHPNFNCGPELYHWLARALALAGFAVVTFAFVGPLIGNRPGLSTGIDLDAVGPGALGTRDPHLFLRALLDRLGGNGELQGTLDLDTLILGGHSAGGTLALLAASRKFHPEVRGAFTYGGHTRAQVPQGYGEAAYLPLAGGVPLLLMAGTADGVVTAVETQQTGQLRPGHPMAHTFDRSIPTGTEAWLVIVEGANHYAFAEGYDGSTGRGYLEAPGSLAPVKLRAALAPLVVEFCRASTGDADAMERLRALDGTGVGIAAEVRHRS